jgi:hypothetical protein
MLISMPTGTSTIFGVFQAILALLAVRTNFALLDKLPRQEKFASEIFHYKPPRVILLQRDSVVPTTFAFRIKQNADIKRLCRVASGGMQGTTNKELVKFVRLPIPLALSH